MRQSYSELVGGMRAEGKGFHATISQDWAQGRTTFGGLTAALCLEAVLRETPGLPPLRSAQIAFIGPAGGPVTVAVKTLRAGRSMTFVEADLFAEAGLATRALFAFGVSRDSVFDRRFAPDATMPPPDACPVFIPEGRGPAFAAHFEQKLAKGARPITGSSEHDHFIWIRHRDPEATTIPALLALADMPPPAVLPMFKAPAPISSVTWIVNFLDAAPQTEDRWWLVESRAENARQGFSSQDMMVWNARGEAVIAARQQVAIFA
ncbi:MAG: thioesterase family protein [Parvularculaceae bacterium]|nr:thioesterase family protein [Parvularculaceae bacterium]